jgi:hypothetical protein
MKLSLIVFAGLFLAGCTGSPTDDGPLTPLSLDVTSGDAQETLVGYRLPTEVIFQVRDLQGRPVEGVAVAITAPVTGSFTHVSSQVTDALGVVAVEWRLGLAIGAQSLNASLIDYPTVATAAQATGLASPVIALDGEQDVMCAVYLDGRVGCWEFDGVSTKPILSMTDASRQFTGLAIAHNAEWDITGCGPTQTDRVWCFDYVRATRSFSNWREVGGSYTALTGLDGSHAEPRSIPPHFCGIDSEGSAWCWGSNELGVLGDGTTTARDDARPVLGHARFTQMSVGDQHVCAVEAAGAAWCWGANSYGELGHPLSLVSSAQPVTVASASKFAGVRTIGFHASCGLERTGQLWCWGSTWHNGQGDHSLTNQANHAPQAVPGMTSVAVFGYFALATYAFNAQGVGAWWGSQGFLESILHLPYPTRDPLPFEEYVGGAPSDFICGRHSASAGVICMHATALTGLLPAHSLRNHPYGLGVPFPPE